MSISLTVLINYTTEKSRSNVTTVAIHTPSSHSLVSKHRPSAKEARTLGRKADSRLGQGKTNVSLKQVSTVLNIWGKQNATSAFSGKASHKIYRTLHVWNKNTLQTQNVNHTLLSKRCLDLQNNPRTHWARVWLVRSAVGTACAVSAPQISCRYGRCHTSVSPWVLISSNLHCKLPLKHVDIFRYRAHRRSTAVKLYDRQRRKKPGKAGTGTNEPLPEPPFLSL